MNKEQLKQAIVDYEADRTGFNEIEVENIKKVKADKEMIQARIIIKEKPFIHYYPLELLKVDKESFNKKKSN